jgi:hypothetical protein
MPNMWGDFQATRKPATQQIINKNLMLKGGPALRGKPNGS